MKAFLKRFIRGDGDQDLIEYAFLAVFIALAVVVGMQAASTGFATPSTNTGVQAPGK